MKWVLCVILLCLVTLVVRSSSSPVEPCYKECDIRLSSDEEDFDVSCNETCKVQKCRDGCDLWTNAISSSCHEVCKEENRVYKNKMSLYCIRGCNIAINEYMKTIEDDLGTPEEPYLVADTRSNTSVTVQWSPPARYPNISYLVQYRYDGSSHTTDYEYYRPGHLLSENLLRVDNLHPYTRYRFRVAFILLENYPPLFSEESIAISTLPYGAPATSPIITCLTAVSCNRLSLSYDPPRLPNGPVLSYVLYIEEHSSGVTMIKDILDTSNGSHYMINNLKPSTLYRVSLSARNSMGEGPCDFRNISTLAKKEVSGSEQSPAYLVFGSKHSVLKKGLRILDEPQPLYKLQNTSVFVKGVALHIKRNLFFLTDSEGNLRSLPLGSGGGGGGERALLSSRHRPTLLSVDHLNDHVYIAEEGQISRCDLNGEQYEAVLVDMPSSTMELHVDPLNGFLFVSMQSLFEGKGGLYRIDLIEFSTGNPLSFYSKATELILGDPHLTAFAIDPRNFRLLLSSNETVISVSLDGGLVSETRERTHMYANMTSLAVHRELFYWTRGELLYGEEYHKKEDRHYQNVYSVGEDSFFSLNVLHPEHEPYPRPLNPVEAVQTLFGVDKARVTWSSPRLLGGLGRGSWQKYLYEVEFHDDGGIIAAAANITANSYFAPSLPPDRTYSVRVRPYSEGGKGPWSKNFHGNTLKRSAQTGYPFLLWGAREGLLRSNFIGERLEPLVLKINLNNAHITDVGYYDNLLFLNTNTSFIYVYDNSSLEASVTRLPNITMATSIAIDWFAPKLYWSSAVQQIISRSNLDGSLAEPLPILTMAKEIAIDSVNAHIYLATSHSVERSRLNGKDHFVYMKSELFSGRHVMGLTLDFDHHKVYWIVRSYEGSIFYRSCLAEDDSALCSPQAPEVVGALSEDGLHGPAFYFSNKLFWMHENRKAFVSDVHGKNFAHLDGPGLKGVTALEMIDPSRQPYPDGLSREKISVIPEAIPESSIEVVGTHDRFNITWRPAQNVNYGTVFYEIRVDDGDEVYFLITTDTAFVYPTMKRLPPFSPLSIGMQAYTYYASSRQTLVSLHSPSSVPSRPLDPRVFVTHKPSPFQSSEEVILTFRWSPPSKKNGIILRYVVACWVRNEQKGANVSPMCTEVQVDGQTLEYQAQYPRGNVTYFFKVHAVTAAGAGATSDVVEVDPSTERPIPRLLLANTDGVCMADMDLQEEKVLFRKTLGALAFLAHEQKLFTLEEGALMMSSMEGDNRSLLKHLKTEGASLSLDWVGRFLYYTQLHREESSIWCYDLSHQGPPRRVLNTSAVIHSLEIEPFSGSLVYTVAFKNSLQLMVLNLKSSSVSPFFQQTTSRAKRATCNCSRSELISGAMTIDRTQVRLLFTDTGYGHIWSSDMQGCICRMLVNATENRNAGLPPTSITVDSSRVYWSNNKTGKVYSIAKNSAETSLRREDFSGIQHVWAIGFNLQPYPDAECLLMGSYMQAAQLVSSTFNSLVLYLPGIQRADICEPISFPSLLYTVHYELDASNNSQVLTTYNQSVVLRDLLPFRNYSVQVSAQNYYSRGVSSLGPRVVYQTAVGTPSAPMNVSAKAVTPFRIDVSWLPPSLPNGHPLFYELRWKSRDSLSTISSECGTEASTGLSSTIITAEPGKKHYITVRAYSSNCELYTDSAEMSLFALPLPNNLTLLHMASTSLTLLWLPPRDDSVQHHVLEYKQVDSTQWQRSHVNETVSSREESVFHIQNLWPKTRYLCRLLLNYKERSAEFIFPYPSPFTTLGDAPSVPGIPEVSHLGREIYEVVWERSSRNNGYTDISYELQMRAELDSSEWQHITNTSTTQWIISSFSGNTNYEFRVRAFNEFGGSNFSRSNKSFYLPEAGALMDTSDDPTGIIIASSVAIVILLSVFMAIIYMIHLKKQQCKKMLQEVPNNELVSDLELATLQDLPYHANFVHETNALYNLNDLPTDEELLALPQIRREQIIVTRFLGSGAFGEVFEGIANGMTADSTTLKIAIKTLKKGATDHEKDEFLKEAKLMSNFKHDHILQLLGVCFDNNPNFIILELMEGGDLLSFLRSNRPTMFEPSRLTLDNLVGICIDVAKGCKYLEDMHFVHRDLAARNCLVSSHDGTRRIVKIGDFGLARDIYKNDYYRKEGEGLLPVRWMSPESLVYGVFTSQSDVWAFGVLLYEVMTLGMQPYPARSNMEVLYYVRAGGRLDKPENCPEDLYELMVGCWSFDPERRPTFCYCLHELQDMRGRLDASATISSTVYNLDYFGHENIGTYIGQNCPEASDENKLLDQNFDSRSIQSVPPSTSDRVLEENPSSLRRSLSWTSAMLHGWPASTKRSANKYLELLGDNEDSDGYQMPLPAPPSRQALSNDMASLTCCESLNCEESCDISLAPLERTEIEEEDNWSFSTASTATCPFDVGSPEGEVTFALSCMAGIDLNHPSNSSYC